MHILLEKCKKSESTFCQCKAIHDDTLTIIVQYKIESFPEFLFILFDLTFEDLDRNKNDIFKLLQNEIMLNYNASYIIKDVINIPIKNHYASVIFNPSCININN